MPESDAAFDFGQNWSEFSANALSPDRLAQARRDFAHLTAGIRLRGKTFLDIGFGQGLSLLIATSLGARSQGCDINPKCRAVLDRNLRLFPELTTPPPALVGSILDEATVARLRESGPPGGYEIVHSWGVLHHTGNMNLAIRNAIGLVAPGGHLILALYNRHWSSSTWKLIKRTYVGSPGWLQRFWIGVFYPVIYAAKWLVTGRNPKRQERGMDFYYDVVDWVGGYPYEYASRTEIEALLTRLGFALVEFRAARVPTGCNEFIFQRKAA